MSPVRRPPSEVIPLAVAEALVSAPAVWFVIGGQAVRCLCPYRPSDDVDLGVGRVRDVSRLVAVLQAKGNVELLEKSRDTVHLVFDGIDVSIFALPRIAAHVEGQSLSVTGILATKLHAILARGTRRDFFDLYVVLQRHRLGIAECLRALDRVYEEPVDQGLLLRALTYFDDAHAEAALPGEGASDWAEVQRFFMTRAGALLLPPETELAIQANVVDVRPTQRRPRR